jgi:integrase
MPGTQERKKRRRRKSPVPHARWFGGQWIFRARVNGQQVTHPLGADPEAAQQQAVQLVAKYQAERMKKQQRPILGTVAALAAKWLKDYVPEHRPGLKAQRLAEQRMRDHVLPIIGTVNLSQVRKHHLSEVKASLREKKIGRKKDKTLSVNSQRHILSDVRAMFYWALDEEIMDFCPFVGKKVLPPKPEQVAPRYLTDIELARILAKAPEPFRSCIVFNERTGLRWSEFRALEWRSVELDGPEPSLLIVRSKGKRPRRIPLDQETVTILKRWLAEAGEREHVSPWRPKQAEWAVTVTKELGVPHWRWHSLRHTFATRYLRDGGAIEALSKLLGHSEIRTTEIYGAIEQRLIQADFTRVRGRVSPDNLSGDLSAAN